MEGGGGGAKKGTPQKKILDSKKKTTQIIFLHKNFQNGGNIICLNPKKVFFPLKFFKLVIENPPIFGSRGWWESVKNAKYTDGSFLCYMRDSKKTFIECYKAHLCALQNEEISSQMKTAEDVKRYLLNFFDHHCGNHENCLSESCKDKEPYDYMTPEWCRQVQEMKQDFDKYLKM